MSINMKTRGAGIALALLLASASTSALAADPNAISQGGKVVAEASIILLDYSNTSIFIPTITYVGTSFNINEPLVVNDVTFRKCSWQVATSGYPTSNYQSVVCTID